jgi:hypothetical protein
LAAAACSSGDSAINAGDGSGAASGAATVSSGASTTQGATASSGSAGPTGSTGATAAGSGGAANGSGSSNTSGPSGDQAGVGVTVVGASSSVGSTGVGGMSASAAAASAVSSSVGSGTGGGATTTANPFDCKFAWGEPSPSGALTSDSWLQFMSQWAGSEVLADGSIPSCSLCSWLTDDMAPTSLIPAYYAYFIGFYGHANGLPDQNQNPNGPNLATGASALILGAANAGCPTGQICASNKIVQMYAKYAQLSHKAWPTKPLIWLIEGDFIQYTAESGTQTQPLTYAQLGQLAVQITTAIKSNMPNAVVAFDDSAWVSDGDRMSYWTAIGAADYDMVWTTGVGNNVPFLNAGETATSYNGMTATYSFLHSYTGKKILVDESAGMSQQSDTWSNQTAATLKTLIADGVVAINVSGAPSTYQANVTALASKLGSTCP